MDLSGKNVVVVGGFGGIGLATCKALLTKGVANLVVLDLEGNVTALKVLRGINPNAQVYFMQYDVTEGIESSRIVLTNVLKKITTFDVLINCAGIVNEEQITETIDTNLTGTVNTTTAAVELWDKRHGGKGGLVVNISSVCGLDAIKDFPVYSASKAGVNQFTRCLAKLHTITGVCALVVCPGITKTTILDNAKSYLNIRSNIPEIITKLAMQSPEVFAEHLMPIIEKAENGSITIISNGQAKAVHIPTFWEVPAELC